MKTSTGAKLKALTAFIVLSGLAAPALAQDASLGRLFLTPEQRVALDNARRNRIRAEALAAAAVQKPKIPPARSIVINGVITRSDGESIVWVNGRPTDGETADGIRVAPASDSQSSIVLREPEKGRKVRLKVGQRADLLTGRIEEAYQRRRAAAADTASGSTAQQPSAATAHGEAARASARSRTNRDEDAPSENTESDDIGSSNNSETGTTQQANASSAPKSTEPAPR
jgi:hypothetical protein